MPAMTSASAMTMKVMRVTMSSCQLAVVSCRWTCTRACSDCAGKRDPCQRPPRLRRCFLRCQFVGTKDPRRLDHQQYDEDGIRGNHRQRVMLMLEASHQQ